MLQIIVRMAWFGGGGGGGGEVRLWVQEEISVQGVCNHGLIRVLYDLDFEEANEVTE